MQHERPENRSQMILPANLNDLLALFLEAPTSQIEHQLTSLPLDPYFSLLSDKDQALEIRMACCSALKGALSQRELHQHSIEQALAQVEQLFLSCELEISGSLQIILEKIFELYLDDEKKLDAFERVIENLTSCRDIRNSYANQKMLRIGILLVGEMASSTLNNEICVGALLCYLKHLYQDQNKTSDLADPSGRGTELLLEAMSTQPRPELLSFITLQTGIVKLIREIIERVESDESQEPAPIPAKYIRISKDIQNLLSAIICTTPNQKLYCQNETVNELKAELLQLYSENYLLHLEQPFLAHAIPAVINSQVSELQDESTRIVSNLILLLKRSTSFPQYAGIFYSANQMLVFKLFQFVTAKSTQKEAVTQNPSFFAEIAYDFCHSQTAQTLKVRAGSLIYNLCLNIDGSLTFVTHFILIPTLDLQRKALSSLMPGFPITPQVASAEKLMKNLLQLWPFDAQELTQTSILILSSISDLLHQRADFNSSIRRHLGVMHNLFALRQKVITFFPTIVICRYLQLYSFFSSPNCLDPFIPLYPLNEAIAQTMLKALQNLIQFHDKQSQDMRAYVANVSTKVLLLSDKLTPLLESTIIATPEVLLCVKERLLQKLVIWLLEHLRQGNVSATNRVANLLCKVLQKYPDYLVHSQPQMHNFQLQALAQYLTPLYHHLLTSKHQEAQECIVEVAIAHCEVWKTCMPQITAEEFLQLGILIVQRNRGALNKCLQLFSRLLTLPQPKTQIFQAQLQRVQGIKLIIASQLLRKIHIWLQSVEPRGQNLWQIAYLIQLVLYTYETCQEQPNHELLDFGYFFQKVESANSKVLTLKAIMIGFLLFHMYPNNVTEGWLLRMSLPQLLPPWEKDHFCIYILRSINQFNSVVVRGKLVSYTLGLLFPCKRLSQYWKNYEERLQCMGYDQVEIFANQAKKDVSHPISSSPIESFEQFKKMFYKEPQFEQMRQLLPIQVQDKIRDALCMRMVGSQLRHVVKLKPIHLRR